MMLKRGLRSLADLEPGDHLCNFYENEEERLAVLKSFISQGLERGEKILCIQESPGDKNILKELAELGIDVEDRLDKGCLSLVTEAETYLREGAFDPQRVIGMLRAETERALARGYPALRAIGDMSWAQRGLPGSEMLVEYEAKSCDFFSENQCLALCQYGLRKFDPRLLLNLLAAHPAVMIGTQIYENIYYIPADELLSDNFLDAALRHFLGNLKAQRQAEARSQEERERFQSLFNGVPVPTYVWQRKGEDFILVTFNRAAQDYTGGGINELLGKMLSELYGDRPEVLADFSRCFREKVTIRREFGQTSRFTGQWREYIIHYVPIAPDLVLLHTEDITERKRAEQALRRQAQIIDQIHDAVVSTDLDGYVTSWNKGAQRIFGYSAAEALGKHISLVYEEDQLDFLQQEVIAPLKEKGDHELEVVMKNKHGQDFDAHLSLSMLTDLSGNPIGMIGYTLDISTLKRTERELRVRARMQAVEAELGQLALVGGNLAALMDQIVSKVAQALEVEYCKILELQLAGEALLLRAGVGWKEGYVGKALVDAKANSQAGYTLLSNWPVVANDLRTETRFAIPPLLSEHEVASGMSVIIQGKERPYGILGAHTTRLREFSEEDVNFLASVANLLAIAIERKRTEQALKENEERFRQLSENIEEVFWMTDAGGDEILYVSPAYEKIWGRKLEGIYVDPGEWQDAIHPLDRKHVKAAFTPEKLMRGEYDVEYRIGRPDGSMRWIRDRGFPVRDENGRFYRIAGIAEDITGRIQTEQVLRQHAQRLKTLREIDRAILAARSLQSIAQSALTRLVKLEPFFGASVVLFDLENSEGTVLYDYHHGAEDLHMGPRISLDLFGDIDDLRAGKVWRVEETRVMSNPDVTLQTLRERGLRSYISVPLITQGELVGVLNLGSTSPGTFPAETVQLAREIANSMALAIQQTRLINRVQEGSERLRELSRQVVTAQEEERRRVSRELHDEASQALTALKISLDMLGKDLPEESQSLHQSIEEAVELADETMERIRLLAHNLRPPELDAVGLDPVLEDYCSEFGKRAHLAIEYQGTRLPGLPDEISICLYRVLQEALTNILKHARARQVQVALGYEEEEITLSVEDDGQGFDQGVDKSPPEGKGIGLVGMRERVELLGGRLEVESHSGEGTRLKATVPWERWA
ncbi:MAG TPA: PAS domain S-box protein [Anaerolineales bacterium]|nr:PAS domain S-box protein [Anaerolineales bacterium]